MSFKECQISRASPDFEQIEKSSRTDNFLPLSKAFSWTDVQSNLCRGCFGPKEYKDEYLWTDLN